MSSGQHIEAVRIAWLLEQKAALAEASAEEREHVFPLLYDLCDSIERLDCKVSAQVKLSVDTFRDLERMRHIIESGAFHDPVIMQQASNCFEESQPFIGENGPYLIAEIGGNHEGDFDHAKELVQSACATEVDAIKLQIYSPDLLVNSKLDPDRWAHFRKFSLLPEEYSELFAIIRDAGKQTSASVWSLEEIEQYEEYIDLLKIGSGDLTNTPILLHLAKLGKPLVLSTGLATMRQARHAHDTVLNAGLAPEKLAILQCTSMYPIPEVEANLAVIEEFKRQFRCVIGYSDHTVGYETLLDSVMAGARVLEFHYSDDTSNVRFRDHLVSLDENDTSAFVEALRVRMARLGSQDKKLTFMERSRNHPVSFRKGVFLRNNVPAGHVVTKSDLIALRPLVGIDAVEFYDLVGKQAKQDIAALDALSWDMFAGSETCRI